MGVGGHFWDLLKPYARTEDFDFLRDKRVAVDLSFWIVQHETAIRAHTRNPHLRLTFFRTINLFSKVNPPVFSFLTLCLASKKMQMGINKWEKCINIRESVVKYVTCVKIRKKCAFSKTKDKKEGNLWVLCVVLFWVGLEELRKLKQFDLGFGLWVLLFNWMTNMVCR